MSALTIDWQAVKQIPIPNYLRARFGLELRYGRCACPIHGGDGQNFSVTQKSGVWLWKCFTHCGKGGTIIDLDMALYGGSAVDAAKRLLGLAPDGGPIIRAPKPDDLESVPVKRQQYHPDLEEPSASDLRALSDLRSIAVEALKIAVKREFLWTADIYDDGEYYQSFVITDKTRKVYLARRLDGKTWANGSKPKTLSGGRGKWAIGVEESRDFPAIALVEGGPDFLAAFGHAWASGVDHLVAPVCVPAANLIDDESLPYFQGKRVRIFVHDDDAGRGATSDWAHQLRGIASGVDGYRFDGLWKADGEPVEDLNDLLMIDADSWEQNRETIESIMNYAMEARKTNGGRISV
ncbi:MAG TPA: hypothetical protein VFO40_11825 [Chthoniobacterales bacterium]|nr:hypothetical protein [Chthoniobacterales bacterium]